MGNRMITGLALLLAALAGHGEQQLVVTDDTGHEVRLPGPAQRVVSLAPHITETLFAVGAGRQIVGTVSYSDYPAAAGQIPQVGNYRDINYELLVGLEPDLVIAWRSGNGDEMIRRLRSLGLTVFVGEPRELPDVAQMLRRFGALTGRAAAGNAAADAFAAELTELAAANRGKPVLEVFYQLWNDPLITLNGEHLISAVIRLCGGRNLFEDSIPIAPRVSLESVISLNPQVIIASGMGEARPEWLDDWHSWPVIDAVKNKRLYFVRPDLLQRHAPRILDGARQLCAHLDRARADLLNGGNHKSTAPSLPTDAGKSY